MRHEPNRRRFLEAAAAATAAPDLVPADRETPCSDAAQNPQAPGPLPKVAALTTTYHYLSHAYHIVGRFWDGFPVHDGGGPHRPPFEVASLFIEQTPIATDLGRAKARRHGLELARSITQALTLGTGKLAVDAVLLIAEHGDYPMNDKLQKLYPRGRFLREVMEVFKTSGRSVPVFLDKHLSYDRTEARQMVQEARALKVPFMAGSSLPVTWRLPALEIPLGRKFKEVLVASRGDLEIFGFHSLETLQCMAERRDLGGRGQGVAAVTYLEGDAVWAAGDRGVWSWELLDHALGRSHTLNPGDIRQNTRDFLPPPPAGHDRPTRPRGPVAYVVEYVDGLKATVLTLNGHVDDTTIAVRMADQAGRESIVSTLMYLPAPPGANFFNPLVLRIEDLFRTGKPPYPVERTLLTGGVLDAALESRATGRRRIVTPDLAVIDYAPPVDSGFIRTPIARPTVNRL